MNEETRTFISTYLYCEVANDDYRSTIAAFNEDWSAAVKRGLAEVIATRELDVAAYDGLTDFEFDSEDELYAYLTKVYAFLFEGAQEEPSLP